MNYKPSQYNISYINQGSSYILFNTKTNQYLKISKANQAIFENILNGKIQNHVVEEYLINNGFWVDEKIDEFEIVKHVYTESIRDSFNMTIMPTLACNFRCPYCFEDISYGRMSDEIERAIIHFVREKLLDYRSFTVQWYGGEPLLEIDLIERLSSEFKHICKINHIPYVSNMITNGYFLSWENYLRLKRSNVRYFTITIDGLPEQHNKTRPLKNGGPTFDTIIDNLRVIRDREASSFLKITIRTNYTKESITYKKEWEKFLEENFLFDRRFAYLPRYAWDNNKGNFDGNYIDFNYDDNITIIDNINTEIDTNETFVAWIERRFLNMRNGSEVCSAGNCNSIIVTPNGDLKKCQVHLNNPINTVGKLTTDKGSIIIHKERLNFWESRESHYTFCKYCELFPYCYSKGCAAKTGNIENISGVWCDVFKKEIQKYLDVLSKKASFSFIENCINQ